MIRLTLGTNSKVDLTLTEKTTIANPTYLFQFTGNQTKGSVYCISQDISAYTERYNRFVIIVKTGVAVPLSGEIQLTIGDEYTYRVYAQTSTTNLDPALADETVEIGMMTYDKVLDTPTEYNGTTTARAVYES